MMDIQKAISLLKRKIRLKDFVNSDYADGVDKELLGFACFALEELAQYRQLGTVNEIRKSLDELQLWHKSHTNERIKNPFANQSTLICHNCDHKDEYIEELESTVEEYEQIGTVDECRTAREKMKPKKAAEDPSTTAMYCGVYICPSCGKKFTGGGISNNCYHCGQALDWTESEGK